MVLFLHGCTQQSATMNAADGGMTDRKQQRLHRYIYGQIFKGLIVMQDIFFYISILYIYLILLL